MEIHEHFINLGFQYHQNFVIYLHLFKKYRFILINFSNLKMINCVFIIKLLLN